MRAFVIVAALGCTTPSRAWAQGGTLAQSLFDQARTLMDDGKFGEACPLLVESQRLDPGGGTLLNIAVCWEGAGKLATANEAFHEALGQAIRDQRSDRRAIAEERLAAIAPRLSTLVVEVPAASRVTDLTITVDGVRLPVVAWGIPASVDGGDHLVEASAPGRSWRETVHVAAERHAARVVVPPLQREGAVVRGAAAPVAPPPPDDDRRCPPGMRVAGDTCERIPPPPDPPTRVSTAQWVTGGIGLGFLAVGGVAGIAALVQDGEAATAAQQAGCGADASSCSRRADLTQANAIADEAATWGWVSTVGLGVGATTLFVALLLPSEVVAEDGPKAAAWFTPESAGARVKLPF